MCAPPAQVDDDLSHPGPLGRDFADAEESSVRGSKKGSRPDGAPEDAG